MKVYNDRKNSVIGDSRKSKQLKFRGSIFKNGLNSNNPTGLVDSDNKKLSTRSRRVSQFIPTNFTLKLTDPVITVLESIEEIVIKQEADIMEAVSGCQKPNNYHVYGRLSNKQLMYIFKCREFSGCCMRCCCPVDCREFDMKIKHMKTGKNNKNDFNKDIYLDVTKPMKCACICLCRPEINAKFSGSNKKNNILGKIKSLLSISDDYVITLPKNSEPEEKLLLIVAGLMIDYQYFEKNGNATSKY